MANETAGKVKFAISATPIETLTSLGSEAATQSIAATQCFGTIGGSGEVTVTAIDDTGGATHGYASGVKHYASAAVGALGTVTIAAADVIVVKHTGFSGAAGTTKGTTANTADVLAVAVNNTSNDVICGYLNSGEAMIIPLKGKAGYFVKCQSLNADLAADGAATIQVEYIAVT